MAEFNASTPGGRLRTARKRSGLTQKDLEARTGVRQSTISEFESGETQDMDASSLVGLCVVVGTTAEYVMIGARVARDDAEAEAIALLRGADDKARELALSALRGMLTASPAAVSRKHQGRRVA